MTVTVGCEKWYKIGQKSLRTRRLTLEKEQLFRKRDSDYGDVKSRS